MTSANGSFDFFNRECVVGTAFKVDRTYLGGQLASGEGVTLVCANQYGYLYTRMIPLKLTFAGNMAGGGG